MCAQLHHQGPQLPPVGSSLVDNPLGIPPYETQIALQQDAVKELVNKLAWVVGSFYRQPYSSMRRPAREYAWALTNRVLADHGYPSKIAK